MNLFPPPGAPRRGIHHNLESIGRTVGGQKVRDVCYAVYTDGSPAGIVGDLWRHGAYRCHRWDDAGKSQWADRFPEYNILIPVLTPEVV